MLIMRRRAAALAPPPAPVPGARCPLAAAGGAAGRDAKAATQRVPPPSATLPAPGVRVHEWRGTLLSSAEGVAGPEERAPPPPPLSPAPGAPRTKPVRLQRLTRRDRNYSTGTIQAVAKQVEVLNSKIDYQQRQE